MNISPLANTLSVSVRIYRALLVAYPKKFREHYETQMVQVFRDSCREAHHRHGMSGVIDLWLHTFIDLVFTALIERIMEGSQHMFSPKVILWGSLASIFAGLFYVMSGLAANGGSFVLALVLSLGGLVALYSRQAGQGGRLGLAGFTLGIIGIGLVLVTLWWAFTSGRLATSGKQIEPVLAAPVVLILWLEQVMLDVGLLLLGVSSLRTKTLHHWRGLPVGLGLLGLVQRMILWFVYYLPLSQGQNPWNPWDFTDVAAGFLYVPLGIGWMALGVMLAAEADAKVAHPEGSPETR